jgi:hypothetical protein
MRGFMRLILEAHGVSIDPDAQTGRNVPMGIL